MLGALIDVELRYGPEGLGSRVAFFAAVEDS
jgi:hypothetical protein